MTLDVVATEARASYHRACSHWGFFPGQDAVLEHLPNPYGKLTIQAYVWRKAIDAEHSARARDILFKHGAGAYLDALNGRNIRQSSWAV